MTRPAIHSVTITSGGATSAASQDLSEFAVVALELPAAFTGTSVSFSVSTDGTNFKTLKRRDGTTYSVSVAADAAVPTAGSLFVPFRYVKVVSNQNEGADRVVRLVLDQDPVAGEEGNTVTSSPAASEVHLGQVGGHTARVVATLTRPNDTTTYAAGDAVADSTSAPTALSFVNVNRATGLGGIIVGASLVDSGSPVVKGPFELWLFNASPTPTNDNAAFAPSDADTLNLICVLPFTTAYVGLAGTTGNSVYHSDVVNRPFIATARTIYGLVVTRGAVIPLANEVYTFILHVSQD